MKVGVGILFFCVCFVASAQISTPKYSNEFLNLPVGARALGMGGVMTSQAEGAESIYWNPSFLIDLESDYNISLMHVELYGGIAAYDYLGFATPIDSVSAFGLGIIRFGIDNIPDTRFLYDAAGNINYDNITFFSAADYAGFISYARKIPRLSDLSLGANMKIIHRRAGDFARAWGFGLDVSLNFKKENWTFGLMGRDITGTFNAWSHSSDLVEDVYQSTGNSIPENSVELTLPKMVIGASREIIARETYHLSIAADLLLSTDGRRNTLLSTGLISGDPRLGAEFDYKGKFYVRSGLSSFQKTSDGSQVNPHFGLGVTIDWMKVDYALSRLEGLDSGLFTHTFSLNISINEGEK